MDTLDRIKAHVPAQRKIEASAKNLAATMGDRTAGNDHATHESWAKKFHALRRLGQR